MFSKYMDFGLFEIFLQMFLSCLNQKILSWEVDVLFGLDFFFLMKRQLLSSRSFDSDMIKTFGEKN